MNSRADLVALQEKSNLFIDLIGDKLEMELINRNEIKVGFFVWARHKPKKLFTHYLELNSLITKNKLNVFIDDNCSKIFMQIDNDEQKRLIEQYFQFFRQSITYLSSDLCNVSTNDFFYFINSIPFKAYYNFLPKRKKEELEILKLSELMHTYLEIKTIEVASSMCDVLFVGKRSSNIAYFYHKHIDAKARFLIIDDFREEP